MLFPEVFLEAWTVEVSGAEYHVSILVSLANDMTVRAEVRVQVPEKV